MTREKEKFLPSSSSSHLKFGFVNFFLLFCVTDILIDVPKSEIPSRPTTRKMKSFIAF
jgi:hypothetical protein